MQQLCRQMHSFVAIVVVVVAVSLFLASICLENVALAAVASAEHDYNWNSESKVPSALPRDGDFFSALNEFSSHTVIRPQIHSRRHKRVTRSTLNAENGLHESFITLSYHHRGKRVYADLQLNDNLLPDEHFLRYQNSKAPKGHVVRNFTRSDVELCHYQGSVRGKPSSRVAVSTCNGGINGVVFDDTDTYFIHSGSDGRLQDDHFLFRHSDMLEKSASCGYKGVGSVDHAHDHHFGENIDWNKLAAGSESVPDHIDNLEFNRILRYKRSYDDSNVIRGPYNANKHSSYVELVIVVDNKVYKSFNENTKKVHSHCKDLANIINALYVPLNIFVALVGVVIWNEANEIDFSSDGDVTLRSFLHYRRTKLVLDHPNDNAQLLTKEQFSGGVVGKALKGPICTHEFSGGFSMEHSQIIAVVAATMAHEMGHNFGMEHDSSDCKCQDEKCIMSASSTSVVPLHWSSCSIDQLNIAFSRGMNYCLRNKPTKLFDSPQCGNGFVEPGEQCDCGLPNYCENTCCDPYTCMLHANASCATGECCDFKTCRPKVAGTECRLAENECDLPEYCTGESEYCPSDVFKRDTESCDNDSAYCYQGTCRSHSNQCRLLWGPTGKSSEHCYWKNAEGKRGGNCGYNRLNSTFIPCKPENVGCGMLHCRHFNERLEFGMESAAVLAHSFINHGGNIVPCRTALVDLGLQSTDPGLTPNGAKCGDGKMCVNQQCLAVEQLRADGMGKECPQNCNGNGVCNSRGNCHCNIGFTGATCLMPGAGGSRDSGPSTNPNSHDAFQRFMYIFFFAVIPLMVVFCWFMYYCRNHPFFTSGKLAENIIKSAGGGGSGSGAAGSKPSSQRNQAASSPQSATLQKSTPSSTDDMNSALLKSSSDSGDAATSIGMFGKFKGFTLRPLNDNNIPNANIVGPNVAFVQPVKKTDAVPQRLAPPPPVSGKNTSIIELTSKQNGTLPRKAPPPPVAAPPALPPPNPGSQARPIISMPVLETSTCAHAKQLTLSLSATPSDMAPVRAAPSVPPAATNSGTLKLASPPLVPLHADPKLNVKRDGTIRRITSFLKKEEKHPAKEKTYIDREKLKNIEISAPMPVVDTSNSDSSDQLDETKNLVKRAQSMRSPTKKSTNIQSFGSMRHPSGPARPKSIVNAAGGARPRSPPPRPPPLKKAVSTTSSGYLLPVGAARSIAETTYDDSDRVENTNETDVDVAIGEVNASALPNDNIYAVIDEIPPAAETLKRSDLVSVCSVASSSGSGDLGLLGEIVNEIEKRNGIYTDNPLSKALPTAKEEEKPPVVMSISEPLKTVAGSNSNYLRPTPLNAPIARVAPTRSDLSPTTAFSSFKPAPAPVTKIFKPAVQGAAPTSASTQQSRFANAASSATTKAKCLSKSPTLVHKKPSATATAPPTKTLVPTTGAAASIAKPKPLTSKPSVAGSRLGRAPSTTSTIASKFGTPTNAAASRTAPVIKSANIASLQQRFESTGNATGAAPGSARK